MREQDMVEAGGWDEEVEVKGKGGGGGEDGDGVEHRVDNTHTHA